MEVKAAESFYESLEKMFGVDEDGKTFEERQAEDERIKKEQRAERGYADTDVWNLFEWFMEMIVPMLKQFREGHNASPSYLGENYTDENGILQNDTCHDEWDKILDRMIFLATEMNEDTCQRKNPLEEKYRKASEEFSTKYGLFGEKLLTDEDKAEAMETGCVKMYTMSNVPEYSALVDEYMDEERKIDEYRVSCKNEFFKLFSEHFYSLWD